MNENEMVDYNRVMEKVRPYDQWMSERQPDFLTGLAPTRKVAQDSLPQHRNTHRR